MDSVNQRIFLFAFITSLTLHGVFFLQAASLNLFSWGREKDKIEVSYLRTPQESKNFFKPTPQRSGKPEFPKLPSRITADNRLPPQYGNEARNSLFNKDRENISLNSPFIKPAFTKTTFAKPEISMSKKKITLPAVDMDKINSPSYISYYQIVREKIRRAAYQNYSRTEVGEAYVTFIISNDGVLKESRLVSEKSSSSPYLREIASKSIREATPFPIFPKELDYSQLSFNVVISFEIE